MSRIAVTCPCGREFFVEPAASGPTVICPDCRRDVPVPVRLAPGRIPGYAPALAAIGGLAAAGVVLILYIRRSHPPGPAADERPEILTPLSRDAGVAPPAKSTPPPAEPASPPVPDPDPRAVALDVERINAAGIVAEALRRRGEAALARTVEGRMREWTAAVDRAAAARRPPPVPPRLRPGDILVRFNGQEVDRADPAWTARYLSEFLTERLGPGAIADCNIVRDGRDLRLDLSWQVCPGEIREMTALLGSAPVPVITPAPAPVPTSVIPDAPASPTAVAFDPAPASAPPAEPPPAPAPAKDPPPPAGEPLPTELRDAVRALIQSTPPAYLKILGWNERRRMETLAEYGRGGTDDVAFLKHRILEDFAAQVRSAREEIDTRIDTLRRALSAGSSTDVLVRKDGTRLEGRVLEEGAESVRFERRSGALRITVTVPREEIVRLDRGGGPAGELPERLKKAGEDLAALAPLLTWCEDNRLADAADLVAWSIVRQDPDHAAARRRLGDRWDPAGRWKPAPPRPR